MSRGNRQEPIFLDDQDCAVFLATLGESCAKTGWLVHTFALMGNHYHLLLETPEANLVAGMKWLQGTYTQRFNSRHKLSGHLLQGRYKARPVDKESGGYFQTVGTYIHLNPARARLFDLETGRLEDYRWSSYRCYLQAKERPVWLVADRLLGALGVEDNPSGIDWFRKYMQERIREVAEGNPPTEAWAGIRRGWCFGSEAFRGAMLEKMDDPLQGHRRSSYSGEEVKQHDEIEAERYIAEGMQRLGLTDEVLCTMAKGAKEKAVLAWYVRLHTTVSRQWLADRLLIGDESRVSRMTKEVRSGDGFGALKEKMVGMTRFTD
jgi:REP element-mobilizing transposase RayT